MDEVAWFDEEWELGSAPGNEHSLALSDDRRVIVEAPAGVILTWMTRRQTNREERPSPSIWSTRRPHDVPRLHHGQSPRPRRPRQVGWSLLMAVPSVAAMAVTIIATGPTRVGLIACAALGFSVCGLFVAEFVSRE